LATEPVNPIRSKTSERSVAPLVRTSNEVKLSVQEEQPLEDTVVKIFRCSKVVKGGRRFSFAALVVVGDRAGTVGIGYGKAKEVPLAVEKAMKDAKKSLHKIQARHRSYRRLQCAGGTRIVRRPGCPYKGLRKHFR